MNIYLFSNTFYFVIIFVLFVIYLHIGKGGIFPPSGLGGHFQKKLI